MITQDAHRSGDDHRTPPRTLTDFQRRLAGMTLSRQLTVAAGYSLGHPHEMAFEPAAKLARHAGVSTSTFVRLGKAVGLQSFSELQCLFRTALREASRSRSGAGDPDPSRPSPDRQPGAQM